LSQIITFTINTNELRFMFDESETVDFSDIMKGPISIPYSRKNGMSAKKGHGRSNRIGTRLDFKGGASSPLDVDEGADDTDEWQQQAQQETDLPRDKCPYKPYKTDFKMHVVL
jgi:hypothetical protein